MCCLALLVYISIRWCAVTQTSIIMIDIDQTSKLGYIGIPVTVCYLNGEKNRFDYPTTEKEVQDLISELRGERSSTKTVCLPERPLCTVEQAIKELELAFNTRDAWEVAIEQGDFPF